MNILIGQLSAQPAATASAPTDEMIALINTRVHPPAPVQADNVHIRSVRLVSDEINDHGGCFPADEHARLCELVIDSPVLIGHDRSRLPVARNFAARRVTDGDRQWVTVWFYWMRGPEGDRLAADIDGGVVKEGSIGFEFRRPQCSICRCDIRRCEHVPGQQYTDDTGVTRLAYYEYRDIIRVLETSLVYRGANPGTRMGNDPVFCKTADTPEGVLGVVLGTEPLPSGDHRCLIGRRDTDNPIACDEFVTVTPVQLSVGDAVRCEDGQWIKLSAPESERLAETTRVNIRDYICGGIAKR